MTNDILFFYITVQPFFVVSVRTSTLNIMFTGIIEEIGRVEKIEQHGDSAGFHIECERVLSDVHLGDSIAVNGVCLTVTAFTDSSFSAFVMKETMSRSALSQLTVDSHVNLERAALVQSRLGGHIVQGHVDGTAELRSVVPTDNWTILSFQVDAQLDRYIVEKGSVTVNGVSLTVTTISEGVFSVSLIPATLEKTVLGELNMGDKVNIEVDIVAKYIEKLGRFTTIS